MPAKLSQIIAELDDIAQSIQKSGDIRMATRIDMVSNELESKRTAGLAEGLSIPKSSEGGAPGWEDADQGQWQDAYEAGNYHKIPVGKDSMSRYLDIPSPADILDRLEFADEGEVNIQASRKAEVQTPIEVDLGDGLDSFSTSGLPEAGDETASHPVDEDQEGSILDFFGTEPAGSLHMPGKSSGAEISEDHEVFEEEPVTSNKKAAKARKILKPVAADVVVKNPKELHNSEAGENVERDQSLGGRGKGGGGECAGPTDIDLGDESGFEEETANMEYASGRKSSRKASKRGGSIRSEVQK